MEHKIIEGGEVYLPFARSRIKALKATGLKYASQQFEIDGCSVKVRIEPGHEYVHLSGGKKYIWVLLTINSARSASTTNPNINSAGGTLSQHTLLFRMKGWDATTAELYHQGEGSVTVPRGTPGLWTDSRTVVSHGYSWSDSPGTYATHWLQTGGYVEGVNWERGLLDPNTGPKSLAEAIAKNPPTGQSFQVPSDATFSFTPFNFHQAGGLWGFAFESYAPPSNYGDATVVATWTYEAYIASRVTDYSSYMNCVSSFAPYGKEAVLCFYATNEDYPSIEQSYTKPANPYVAPAGHGTSTIRKTTMLQWGAAPNNHSVSYTYTRVATGDSAENESPSYTTTESGHITGNPLYLSGKGADFFTATHPYSSVDGAEWFQTRANGTLVPIDMLGIGWDYAEGPVVAYLAEGDAGWRADDPLNPMSPRKRTRVEVASPHQGTDFIQYFEEDDNPVYKRDNTGVKRLRDGVRAFSLSYSEYFAFDRNVPGTLRLHSQPGDSSTRNAGKTMLLSDLLVSTAKRPLPAIHPGFARGIPTLSTLFAKRNGSPPANWRRDMNTLIGSGWVEGDTGWGIKVQILPDQQGLFSAGSWI